MCQTKKRLIGEMCSVQTLRGKDCGQMRSTECQVQHWPPLLSGDTIIYRQSLTREAVVRQQTFEQTGLRRVLPT